MWPSLLLCRSQWPRGLRRRFAAAPLLRSWVRIPPGTWMFVCRECCVLPSRGLCDELITRPDESFRLWCIIVCDLETSRMRKPWPALGRSATKKKANYSNTISLLFYCRLSFAIVGLKIFSLPYFVLKSPKQNFPLVLKKWLKPCCNSS